MDAAIHSEAAARPWRTAAVVAGAFAVIELLVLVAIGLALLSGPLTRAVRHHPAAAPSAPARRIVGPPRVARLTRAQTRVLVLNGNGRTGAAAAEALTLQTLGYRIGGTGNSPRRDHGGSIVMYRPGYRPEALRLAHDRGITLVGPLDGLRAADLRGAQLSLVLGS
ncbi:MAG: LytR C-terminal domain-containing protein [Gaiellaceae bacterium]